MTALNKLSIPQLIARLNSLGVEWVGATSRKAPLVEMVESLEPQFSRDDEEIKRACEKLRESKEEAQLCHLVTILRHWGNTLTSDEVADPHTLQQRVLEIARQKYPPAEPLPSLDKVLSYSWEELTHLHHAQLERICQVIGLSLGGGEIPDYKFIRATIAGMRRRPDRDLVFDPAGCQYIYESKTGFQHKIAEDMWENPTKPLYHALVLQDLKQRGFYEPDCVTDALHGLYLVCDLADAPVVKTKTHQFDTGDAVTLKEAEPNINIEPSVWFHPGDKGEVIGMVGEDICRIEICLGGERFYFLAKQSSLKPYRP